MPARNATPAAGAAPESEAQQRAQPWFEALRDRICADFEALEDALDGGPHRDRPPGRFIRKPWPRPGDNDAENGGGGVMAVMRGRVFEKVGVNVSTVHGVFSAPFRAEISGAEDSGGHFWASGVSLVAHPWSPLVPPAHMNTRMIVTARRWFGGGADLNPSHPIAEDTAAFHGALKETCDRFDPAYYPKFSAWCDRYFHIKHWNEPRGIGGIFFDDLDTGDWEQDFAFVRAVGESFADIYPRLMTRRMNAPWTEEQRQRQLVKRGRYAEFNLLYDRGTRFGLMTGGNPEAVLMSLPPEARWP